MKDAPRSRRLYAANPKDQIDQYGGDELASEPSGSNALKQPERLPDNREHLGIDDEHKTAEMQKRHRGTFP